MKVLMLSIYDPLKGGSGPSNHVKNLCGSLRDWGCEVHVLLNGSKTGTVKINGLFIHYYKAPLGFLSKGFLFSLFSLGVINQIIKKYDIDVVHGQSPSGFAYALFFKGKVPIVVTVHSTSFGELAALTNVPLSCINRQLLADALLVQPLSAFLTFLEYKRADNVIVMGKDMARETAGFYKLPSKKISIIDSSLSPVFKHENEKNIRVEHELLFIGRLIWRKGIQFIIDAMPEILKAYPDTKLVILGNGEQKKSLQERVKKKNLENSVEFLERVSEEKLIQVYQEANVYLQPSLYEPLGMAIFEALLMGKIVIATNVGGTPELIVHNENGILIKPASSAEIAKAVIKVFSNPQLQEKIRRNAKENAKVKVENSMDWKSISKRSIELYEKLQKNQPCSQKPLTKQ
jgi:glycosyltransferase involved in cell wall biosynthesis